MIYSRAVFKWKKIQSGVISARSVLLKGSEWPVPSRTAPSSTRTTPARTRSGTPHAPPAEREPAGAAALLHNVLELHDGHADQLVLARKAVILTADVQLVAFRLVLVSQDAAKRNTSHGVAPTRQAGLLLLPTQILLRVISTHNWKLSLNLGDQLLLLDLVECLRFLSLRCGPMRCTSMKGRNMPFVRHFTSFAATTEMSVSGRVSLRGHTPEFPHTHIRAFTHAKDTETHAFAYVHAHTFSIRSFTHSLSLSVSASLVCLSLLTHTLTLSAGERTRTICYPFALVVVAEVDACWVASAMQRGLSKRNARRIPSHTNKDKHHMGGPLDEYSCSLSPLVEFCRTDRLRTPYL